MTIMAMTLTMMRMAQVKAMPDIKEIDKRLLLFKYSIIMMRKIILVAMIITMMRMVMIMMILMDENGDDSKGQGNASD